MTGIPAAGKTTMAEYLSERMHLPVFSKDTVKELLYDHVGFHSRKEKVNLGIAGMEMIYITLNIFPKRESRLFWKSTGIPR